MKDPRSLRIEDFTYHLPDEQVAKYPLEERDASKLLVYQNGVQAEDVYKNIAQHIPADTLLVFNQTKVVHARLLFQKATGGVIEVFCLEPHSQYSNIYTAMQQHGKVWWRCMIGGASKWKTGMVLQIVHNVAPAFTLSAKIVDKEGSDYVLELTWDNEALTFAEVIHYIGKVPLPPYLHRHAEVTDEERYQTIYAKEEGSVAAPTAGLHFTPQVMVSLEEKGVDKAFVTLHVGAGTFKPVKSDTMEAHDMHAEWIDVSLQTIQQLITHLDKGIVAVGTTSLRTLESLYWIGCKIMKGESIEGIAVSQWDPYRQQSDITPLAALQAIAGWMQECGREQLMTRTQILIAPGYDFKIVKGLITNFHQPQSTLLLLVSALIGEWQPLYNHALQHGYRFLSYGDGCLLWR